MRILVADDDPVSRLKLAAALVKSGHEVVEVEDGEAAWKVLQEQDAPKMALLDWMMPKMEGVDVIRKVRAVFRNDPIYLILITSRNSRQDRVQGLEGGADDYLTKPFDPVELRARISAGARIVQLQASLAQRVTQLQSALAARRKLQEALLKEEHHLHSLMDHVPDAIYFKDTSSRFTRVNRTQARRMRLADPSEVIGKTDFDFFTPEHAQPAFEDEQEIIRTGKPMLAKEEKETWPDGRVTWAVSSKMPLLSPAGEIIGTFGITHDITERKRAEEESRFLASIVEASSDAISAVNLDGTIVSWNRGAEFMYGYRADEVNGKSISILIPTERPDEMDQILKELRQGKRVFHLETVRLAKDGRRIDVSLTCFPITDGKGRVTGSAAIAHDITARKRADEELSLERSLLRTLIDTLPDSVFVKDTEGRFVIDNVAHWRLLGAREQTDVVGKTVFDYFPPELASRYFADEQEVIASGQPLINREEPSVDHAGNPRWLLTSRVPLRDHSGKIIGLVGVNHDITGQKQAEEALRESESRFRLFVEQAPAAIAMFDREMRYVAVSRRWLEDNGLDAKNIVGRSHYEVFPDIPDRLKEVHQRCLAGAVEKREEESIERAGGLTDWVRWEMHPWRQGTGEIGGAILFLETITERKLAHDALRDSEEQFRQLAENIHEAFFIADAQITQILYISPAYEEIWGRAREDLYRDPRSWAEAIHPEDGGLARSMMEKEMRGERAEAEFRIVRPDGSVRWVSNRAFPVLDSAGHLTRIVGFAEDITERKRAEHELTQERNLFNALMEHIPDTIYFQDTACRFVRINRAQAKMLGVTNPQDAIGKTDFDFFPADIAQGFYESEQKLMQSGEPIIGAVQKITKPDGEVQWLSATEVPIRDEHGKVIGFVGISRDITERTQAEAENQRLATAIEQTADGIVITDTKGTIQYTNPAFTTITGYSANDMVGQNPRILKSGAQDAGFYQSMWNTVLSGNIWHGELINRRKNGTSYVEEMSIAPVRDGTGAITNFVAINQDVTERKRAEEALSQERSLLRTLIDNLPDYVYVKDTEGRFMIANAGVARLIGVAEGQDLLGKSNFDFFPNELAAQYRRDEQEVIRSGQSMIDREETTVNARGNLRWHLTTRVPFRNALGDIVGLVGIGRDITERKHAEDELRRSEAYLAAGQRLSHTGSWAWNVSSGKLFWSQEAFRIFGFDPSATKAGIAETFLPRIHPEDRPRIEQGLNTAPIETKNHRVEYRIVLPDGSVKHIQDEVYPVTDEAGKVIERYGVVMDVTERKRAEEDLYRSRQMLQSILDNIPQCVFWKDRNSTYLGCNQPFATDAGLNNPADIIGKSDFDLAWGRTAELYRSDDKLAMEQGSPQLNFDEPQSRPDGSLVWLRTSKLPLRDQFGKVIGVLGTYEDITERKQAAEALLRSEEKARLLFATIPNPIWVFDLETLDFLEVNEAAVTRYGYSRAEFLGMKVTDIRPVEERERLANELREPRRAKQISGGWRHRSKDGNIFEVEISSHTLDYGGRKAALVVATDVSERKRLEVDLRQAQKLEAVGQLAAGIAHEINTPVQFVGDNVRFFQDAFRDLQKLLMSYEELRRAAAGRVDAGLLAGVAEAEGQADWQYLRAEVPKALEQTLDGVGRVSRIVRAMKDFSHVGRSGEKAAADLNRALESTLVVARNELKYVADVETEFGEIPPVVCNLGDLNQVFLNLLINAAHAIADVVKGTGSKGKIRVRTWREGEQVVVAISDTGGGIPDEIREKIFEPFFTTKDVGKGTGQGLTLARNVVVERHGGTVTFETELGKGSTFFVRLPIGSSPGDRQSEERIIRAGKVTV